MRSPTLSPHRRHRAGFRAPLFGSGVASDSCERAGVSAGSIGNEQASPHALLHAEQDPEQPTTLSALQRGQRTSGEAKPHAGHVARMPMMPPYATPRTWATKPPSRNASVIENANRPSMYTQPRSLSTTMALAMHGTNNVIVTIATSNWGLVSLYW